MNASAKAARERIVTSANALRWELGERFHDDMVEALYEEASRIASRVISTPEKKEHLHWERILDRIVTHQWGGFLVMFLLLAGVFWVTIVGANYPSEVLSILLLETIHPALKNVGLAIGFPSWLSGFLFDGVYLASAWVVSVMLPPMAIFFPLFTLLEDFGYLPRVAFNLDSFFRRVGAHGKQALTMAMGYGCNAAGVIATRIIDSPRERLIAILTNNFSLCNGRWPTQILIATIFIGALAPPHLSSAFAALGVVAVVLIGVVFVFIVSWGLSRTVLRGAPSMFSLELPPYRPPRILQTLYTSLIDRTVFVLRRAVIWAVPAGGLIWLVSNIHIAERSAAEHIISALDPFGHLIGLNGVILLAYVIAIPANEIVIPTVLMLTALTAGLTGLGSGAGVLFNLETASATATVLLAGGWTTLTGINLMLFSLLHNPCSTTLHTIYRETGSAKWTTVAGVLPVVIGLTVCFFVAQVWRLLA